MPRKKTTLQRAVATGWTYAIKVPATLRDLYVCEASRGRGTHAARGLGVNADDALEECVRQVEARQLLGR